MTSLPPVLRALFPLAFGLSFFLAGRADGLIFGLGMEAWASVRPILNIAVPQTGHFPRVAGVPDAVYTASAFSMGRFSRHFRQ